MKLLHEINEIAIVVKLLRLWSLLCCRLVPSCCVIFDLEPLSLFFDFVFTSEIFKSLSFSLDRLCHLAILCLDQHAHTLHHLESFLSEFAEFEYEHVVQFRRTSLTGFQLKVFRSSNAYALDSPYLACSQLPEPSKADIHDYEFDTSLIHIESHKSPTESLFDVGSSRISIFTVNTKEYHLDVLAKSQG
ncbi:hypothetical protein Tco_0950060 [Tanacetum coccineum]